MAEFVSGSPSGITALASAIATNAIDRLVLDFARQHTFLPKLCWGVDITGENTLTHIFPQFGSITAASTTEGNDLVPAVLDANQAGSLTVGEVAVLVELTKLGAVASGGRVNIDVVARQCGLAVADKLELDIGATFSSISATEGTTNTPMSLDDFELSLTTLRIANTPVENPENNAPKQGIYCVLSEAQLSNMTQALTKANYFFIAPTESGILNDAGKVPAQLRGYYKGIPFFGSNKLGTANAGVDAIGAMFGPTALGLVTLGGPQTLTLERPRGRSDDLVVMQWYGAGIVVNSYAVKIVNRNS
jgi:hypothetical protein